jgi:aspartate/methionine/tyrosine aminotransferase
LILVDEVYAEAQYEDASLPIPAARRGDPFVTTNSLTKAYGLAGLRCGWVLASPQVSQRIREIRDAVDGSGPFVAERLALTAFEQIDRLRARARTILSRNLSAVRELAANHPRLEWLEPAAGTTAFPRVAGIDDTRSLVDALVREQDTIAVPGHFFQSPRHIRISFGGEGAMVDEAMARLGRALS